MKIHPRESIVQEAGCDIGLALVRDAEKMNADKFILLLLKEMEAVITENPVREDGTKQIRDIKQKFQLTDIEYLQILTQEIQTALKYALRYERHKDTSKPAGIE